MASVKLWNTELGKMTTYDVTIDRNGEVVCTYDDGKVNDMIKFPGGLTKSAFDKLVDKHNKANDGVKALDTKALEARDKKNEALLEALS